MKPFSGKDIVSILKNSCIYHGNDATIFNGCKPVMDCIVSDLSWVRPGVKKADQYINNSLAGGIICDDKTFALFSGDVNSKFFVISVNPLLAFAKILNHVENIVSATEENQIHATAVVHPGCTLGKGIKIGAYSIVDEAIIGDNTTIGNNVRIFNNVTIGQKCDIREFCSIGGAGFGIVKDEDGNNMHVPHIGNVIIGDGVLIFPFSNVDKGMLGETIIENNVVIDHYCHIGHNTFTGKNTIITAGTVLAGGSKIKNNCFIGVHTVLKEKTEIGAYVTTGAGAIVTSNIPDNETWVGNPACEISSFVKQRAFIKKNV